MDKEAFLHQLESSATKKDKKLFAKTFYDLQPDVIIGFTKEEFSRTIYISHQFSKRGERQDQIYAKRDVAHN